jgi:cyclic pyranopterin phosphate synthase
MSFSHLDKENKQPQMVDVSPKNESKRTAIAEAVIFLPEEVTRLFKEGEIQSAKGAVVQTAVIAGVFAAKKTGDLIPLCHPLNLEDCTFVHQLVGNELILRVRTSLTGKTGVEMEAMTAVSVAALTVYDMCKSVTKDCFVKNIRLLYKSGGKSGIYRAEGFTGEPEKLF